MIIEMLEDNCYRKTFMHLKLVIERPRKKNLQVKKEKTKITN